MPTIKDRSRRLFDPLCGCEVVQVDGSPRPLWIVGCVALLSLAPIIDEADHVLTPKQRSAADALSLESSGIMMMITVEPASVHRDRKEYTAFNDGRRLGWT